MSDHLVSLPDIVCLQSHPRQPASLHEVDQHVSDGLEVVSPALFYALVHPGLTHTEELANYHLVGVYGHVADSSCNISTDQTSLPLPCLTCNGPVLSIGHVSPSLGVNVGLGQTKVHTVDDVLFLFCCSSDQKVLRFDVPEGQHIELY